MEVSVDAVRWSSQCDKIKTVPWLMTGGGGAFGGGAVREEDSVCFTRIHHGGMRWLSRPEFDP